MEDPKQMNGNANEMANERLEPIPGPRVLPLVGNLFDLDLSNGLQAILDMAKKYGPIFRITVAGQTQIFAASREMVDEFCDESRFQKVVMGGVERLRVVVKDGLFTAHNHEEGWAIAHRIIRPALGPMKIREMFGNMHDITTQFCLKLARIGPTSPIDITEGFTKLTMDTLALCTASFRFNSFYRGSEEHPFVQAINEVLHEADLQSCFPDFINALRIFAARRLKRNMEFMRQVSQDIIQDRQNTSADSNDLLHALLSGRDSVTGKGLTEDQIINNLITFLVAGHETTAGMISFAVYYLLANPDCLRRARQEVDDVIGTDEVKVEHLSKLSYLEAVLKETLRLMPTAPGFSVAPSSPQTVGGKYLIQPGESVIILSAASHRDSSVFGDDADEFKPERMLEEKFNKLPRNSWKPFGNGKRGCIGRAFAWQEAHLIISMLLHNFDIEFDDPSYELRIHETLTIKPEGLLVRTKLREDREYTGLAIQAATNKGRLTQTGAANEPIGGPITILYGSNSGSCKSLAYRLASNASSRGYNQQRILTLDEAVGRLPTDQPVVIVTTSYNGEPTDDGREFVSWVKNVPKRGFAGVSYAVFGCGHRDWIQDFHRVPTLIDERIHKAGAHRLTGRGAADAAISDLYSDLEKWEEDHLWPAIRVKFPAAESSIDLSKLPQAEVHVKQPLRVTLNSRLTGVVVTEAHRLTSPEEPEKRHLEFAIPPESDLSLRPGDHLNILPRNPPRDVERVLSRFQLSPNHLLTVTSFHGGGIPVGTPLTATELFSAYVELAQPATPKNIEILCDSADEENTKERLTHMKDSPDESTRPNLSSVLDLLEELPTHPLSLASFISMLPGLRLRIYSLSSSPTYNPNHASLTYLVLKSQSRETIINPEREHLGVGSNYLASLTPGSILYVSARPAKPAFHLPNDQAATPIIMICAGSGLAPFMSFIQERVALLGTGKKLGPGLLIFGCRHPGRDDLYFDKLAQWESLGAIQVKRAYSRAVDNPGAAGCRYVQDRLLKGSELIHSLWDQGARIYVCGARPMAEGVRAACEDILGTHLKDSEDVGEERYVAEIF